MGSHARWAKRGVAGLLVLGIVALLWVDWLLSDQTLTSQSEGLPPPPGSTQVSPINSADAKRDPAVWAPATYEDTGGRGMARITLITLDDPFEGYARRDAPETGRRYLVATVAVDNISAVPLDLGTAAFHLRDASGALYAPCAKLERSFRRADLKPLAGGVLAPGEVRTGVVCFEVPEAVRLSQILFAPPAATPLAVVELEFRDGVLD